MNKFTIVGILSCVAGALLLGFQSISSIMEIDGKWKSISLVDVIEPEHFTWIDEISFQSIQSAADYIVTMPLFILLFCIGGFFFLLNAIFGD